ncbi:PTS fructose transporter subunit IIB [Halorubrum sp. N11]|uniref:PTS fructose transporter subunit IIB n=1 Tax=Halorubrum sp. N11 TaxID=3402276 RepID=UPI003EB80F74
MEIVAVTACPTGIAHSQMGAEALERAATDAGHEIHVEVQGAMGTENGLTTDQIETADVALVAADIRVDTDRFAALPTVNVSVSEAVTDPEGLIDRAARSAHDADPRTETTPESRTDGSHGLLARIMRLLR